MLDFFKVFSAVVFSIFVLVGCSGSDGDDFGLGNGSGDFEQSGSGGSGGDSDDEETTNVSYRPLAVYEAYSDFSGFASDGLFQGESAFPFIQVFLINPINATTLNSTSSAVVDDYKVEIDDVEIDDTESFPTLQRVVGNTTFLRTALVFDVSGSVDEVDIAALVAEAKAYVAAAQSNGDETIATQEFVVWAFGRDVEELTAGFTSDPVAVNAALDLVETRFNAGTLGSTSNLHLAVLQAVGRYIDGTYDFSADGDNDLVDIATTNGVVLSQMAIFSSGNDTALSVESDLMVRAIQSQGFLTYDLAAPSASEFLNKPVFYYVVGGDTAGEAYETLSEESEELGYLTLNGGSYSFSDDLIQNQIDAIDSRVDRDNQYLYRYAFLPREGDHTAVFSSKAANFNYSLTIDFTAAGLLPFAALGTPAEELASLVEITGPNGEFLSNSAASIAEVSTFAPATRWVNTEYAAGDYSWSVQSGTITGTANADGTYTVSTIGAGTNVLRLTNTITGHVADLTLVD